MSHPQDVVLAISFTDAEHDGSAEAVMSRVLARLRLRWNRLAGVV
jgi:hypothetical protein